MASPKKRRVQGGRVTPKGTQPHARRSVETVRELSLESSAPWVVWMLFGLLALGMLIIFLNYVGMVPGGDTHNGFTLLGLGFILAGIITATRLR
ncbi:MAG: cell division protein CrgA [Acidimicrobiia bacterium]|nr:cell division protein CrgA [Acidimicrobiia bacterium]